ncbi:MAG: hypothetical protein BroJett003_24410 [Planctomycetota bacterium]|nr:MAG: hypothetical protein BroJett003_24410 [Planctomycetota bacterium]
MGWGQWLLAMALTAVCALMIVVILLQRGRGGGLVGVFGGGGAGSAFGAKTGDVFTWITVALAGLFIFIGSVGNCVMEPKIPTDDGAALTEDGGLTEEDINADLPPPSPPSQGTTSSPPAPGASAPSTPPAESGEATKPAAPSNAGAEGENKSAAPPEGGGSANPTPPGAGESDKNAGGAEGGSGNA